MLNADRNIDCNISVLHGGRSYLPPSKNAPPPFRILTSHSKQRLHFLYPHPSSVPYPYRTVSVSYDVMTPSAARGLLEGIYWHPGLQWRIDKIYVLSPIRMTNIRRNEVKSKTSANSILPIEAPLLPVSPGKTEV